MNLLKQREREREREQRSRRTLYLACLPGSLTWWSTSIPAREWPQCHGSLYLTCDFRKTLNNQYILGIANTNSSPTIRISRYIQHTLCKKCTLFASFVGCDAVFINLLKKKTSSVINTCVCNFKIFFTMISNTVLKQNTCSRLKSGCWTHIRIN